jgi:hypothetical protein
MRRWLPWGVALVVTAGCLAGQVRPPRDQQPQRDPSVPLAAYENLFREILRSEKRADYLAQRGLPAEWVRHRYRFRLGLTPEHEARLKEIAESWSQDAAPLFARAKALREDIGRATAGSADAGLTAKADELSGIAAQQRALAQSARDSLAGTFGQAGFASLERAILLDGVAGPAVDKALGACFSWNPMYLEIEEPDYQAPMQPCGDFQVYPTECGTGRVFFYQILDQFGSPIMASLSIGDKISSYEPDTCFMGSNFATTPPGTFSNEDGTFVESLTLCSTGCCAVGACTAACETTAAQVWAIGTGIITKNLDYRCNQILVDGQ